MTDDTTRESGPAHGGTARGALEERVLDGALECLSRWGMSKTTAEDIARAAGVSRATMYRAFPGGMATILEATSAREIERLMAEVVAAVDTAGDVADALVGGICTAGRFITDHATFQYLLTHEPEALLPYFAFDSIGPVLAYTTAALAPSLERFVPGHVAEELVEWAARMVISLTLHPGLVDVTDRGEVGDLVTGLLLPGFAGELHTDRVAAAPVPPPATATAVSATKDLQ